MESSRVSVLIIRHMNGIFPSVEAGLKHLANYLLADYLDDRSSPSLVGFQGYLYDLPSMVASGPPLPSFCVSHWNCEKWWPWDKLSDVYPYLRYFWENTESAESLLCHHVSADAIADKEFRLEVLDFQLKPGTDEYAIEAWKHDRSAAAWEPVIKPKKAKKRKAKPSK